jgi:hypothetical protein
VSASLQHHPPHLCVSQDPMAGFGVLVPRHFACSQAGCGKHSDNLSRCARCKVVSYCDAQCQAAHWPQHRKVCAEVAARFASQAAAADARTAAHRQRRTVPLSESEREETARHMATHLLSSIAEDVYPAKDGEGAYGVEMGDPMGAGSAVYAVWRAVYYPCLSALSYGTTESSLASPGGAAAVDEIAAAFKARDGASALRSQGQIAGHRAAAGRPVRARAAAQGRLRLGAVGVGPPGQDRGPLLRTGGR